MAFNPLRTASGAIGFDYKSTPKNASHNKNKNVKEAINSDGDGDVGSLCARRKKTTIRDSIKETIKWVASSQHKGSGKKKRLGLGIAF